MTFSFHLFITVSLNSSAFKLANTHFIIKQVQKTIDATKGLDHHTLYINFKLNVENVSNENDWVAKSNYLDWVATFNCLDYAAAFNCPDRVATFNCLDWAATFDCLDIVATFNCLDWAETFNCLDCQSYHPCCTFHP